MESHQMPRLPVYLFIAAGFCFLFATTIEGTVLVPFLYGVAAVLIVISETCFIYTYLKKRRAEKAEKKRQKQEKK